MNTIFSLSDETNFLKKTVLNFKKLLAFLPFGNFGIFYTSGKVYDAKANQTETILLNRRGTMIYLYVKVFGGPFPIEPTKEEQVYINRIWEAMGYPENIVVV